MKNILLFSDLHITQSSLKECVLILEEIGMLANKYNVDTIINCGDTFDNLKPTSSELDVFATFIRRVNKKIIILAANSHESETEERSILNHYGILSDNVEVVKEFKDGNHLYCGHYSIKESSSNYDAKLSKEDLKQYLYVFLGHIHSYFLIKPNIVHIGSCRYINFDEAKDKHKIVALITDYDTETEKVHFLKLNMPMSMIQLELGKKVIENTQKEAQGCTISSSNKSTDKDTLESKSSISQVQTSQNSKRFETICQLTSFLDKIDQKTKIKVKILDFESFRLFLPLVNKYTSKFEVFKYSTEFNVVSPNHQICQSTESKSFKKSFTNWLKNQTIDQKIMEILQKEVE